MVCSVITGKSIDHKLTEEQQAALKEIVKSNKVVAQSTNTRNVNITWLKETNEYYLNKDGIVYGRYSPDFGILHVSSETDVEELIATFS